MKLSKRKRRNKILFVIIELELLVLLAVLLYFIRYAQNVNSVTVYADESSVPEITAANGHLVYNTVSMDVPVEGAIYEVGYDWSRNDSDYPSVPTSASAYYTEDSGNISYEILLYRDKIFSKKEGITLDKWYQSWPQQPDGSGDQVPYKTPDTKGFLIRTSSGSAESESTYCSYDYYFAVETGSTIEQYVLELIFYSPDSISKAEKLFKSCARSLSTMNSSHT